MPQDIDRVDHRIRVPCRVLCRGSGSVGSDSSTSSKKAHARISIYGCNRGQNRAGAAFSSTSQKDALQRGISIQIQTQCSGATQRLAIDRGWRPSLVLQD